MAAASTVEPMYKAKVLTPIRPNVAVSLRLPIPAMIENNTKGMAMSFNRLINIVPKGAIQSIVKSLQPIKELNNAQAIPKTRPIIICTGSDGFFIECISSFLSSDQQGPILSWPPQWEPHAEPRKDRVDLSPQAKQISLHCSLCFVPFLWWLQV